MKRLGVFLLSFMIVNISDAVANEDKKYSFNSRTVESALSDAKFGEYQLEKLMGKDSLLDGTLFHDGVYGPIDGFTKGTRVDADKWKKYYRDAYNDIIKALDKYEYKFSLRDAFKECVKYLPSSKDYGARTINHAKGCKDFVMNLVSESFRGSNESGLSTCTNLLKDYRMIDAEESSGVIDSWKTLWRSGEYYCGGYCNRLGDDTVFIIDRNRGEVLHSVTVDDFCDGESGGEYYWYYYDGSSTKYVKEKDETEELENLIKTIYIP